MSTNIRMIGGYTFGVNYDVEEIEKLLLDPEKYAPTGWYKFRMARANDEVRNVRLDAIIEYHSGHSRSAEHSVGDDS